MTGRRVFLRELPVFGSRSRLSWGVGRPHRYDESLGVEALWAPVVDAWLASRYEVHVAELEDELRGIDRFLTRPADVTVTSLDAKHDRLAHRTGNVFLETVSNDQSGRPGWALTSEADWILYHVVAERRVLLFLTSELRDVAGWSRWRERSVRNEGYRTVGQLVPVAVASHVARYDVTLADPCPRL